MNPESFNLSSDSSNLCKELETSFPKLLTNRGKGGDEGYKERSSSHYMKMIFLYVNFLKVASEGYKLKVWKVSTFQYQLF